jgi:hypothetical protein
MMVKGIQSEATVNIWGRPAGSCHTVPGAMGQVNRTGVMTGLRAAKYDVVPANAGTHTA